MARINVLNAYPRLSEEFGYGVSCYEPLVQSFGRRTLVEADDNDYQGDSYRLLADGDEPGQVYGLLTFGCSRSRRRSPRANRLLSLQVQYNSNNHKVSNGGLMATSDIKRGAVVEGVVIGRKSHSLDVMVGETRGTLRYDELNESTESACWARFEALVNGSRLWLKVLSVNPLKLTQRG